LKKMVYFLLRKRFIFFVLQKKFNDFAWQNRFINLRHSGNVFAGKAIYSSFFILHSIGLFGMARKRRMKNEELFLMKNEE